MGSARIFGETREKGDGVGDVGASGDGRLHESTKSFTIRFVAHGSDFGDGGRALIMRE